MYNYVTIKLQPVSMGKHKSSVDGLSSPLLIDLLTKLLSAFYQRGLVDLEGEWQLQCEILCSPSHFFLDYIDHLIKEKMLGHILNHWKFSFIPSY